MKDCGDEKKNVKEHVVEVKLLLQVHLPLLLLLLPMDQVGVLQSLANQLLSLKSCEVCHTQTGVVSPAQSYA
jgi:hypothetical protein